MTAAPATFAVVGTGWRAEFFHRAARALPDVLRVTGVVTRSGRDEVEGVPAFATIAALLAAGRPDFVVVSVPREVAPHVIRELVAAGVPTVAETPPAPELDDLRALWADVGASGLVQVAEQYPRYPGHAARRAVVERGLIGRPTSVHVSSTHDYHAVALMRSLLGAPPGEATVHASRFDSPLVDPMGRDAWTDDDTEKTATTVLATIDFGGGSGLYDFTSNQWHNQLRHRRILVRGSRGEIADDDVVWLADARTVIDARIERRQQGYDLDLDGYATDHLALGGDVLWRNPFPGQRLSDEEIAIAELLVTAGDWARGDGPGPYALAEACHDHAVALAIAASLASGQAVRVEPDAWATPGF